MRDDSADYRSILLGGAPLMDVRAPVEFAKGAFPGSVNSPLMNDLERQKVGTCYKQHGQQAALDLGHRLVAGPVREERIAAWADFARAHPDGYLYCFRGGLRSQIAQQWLAETGLRLPRVIGGYKAMRTFLIEGLEQTLAQCSFVLVGGLTGTGKTDVLAQLANGVDLEAHANHRGSSFGKRATPQPAQIDFENALAIDLLSRRATGMESFVLEDEGRIIGSCSLPLPLYQGMQTFPLVWLEESLANRVERIRRDYVVDLCAEFVAVHGPEQGPLLFADRLRDSLRNIVKRLGRERYAELAALLEAALARQLADGDAMLHGAWIEALLRDYYDPMYAYQLEKKSQRIEFRGDQRAVVDYLRTRTQPSRGNLATA